MAWKKLGRIYDPEKWVNVAKGGYGANPIATKLDDSDGVRIFFNIRDERNNSHVTWLDYDIEKNEIKSFSGERLISPGDRGTFDDCGCSLGSIVNLGKQLYIYYLGWNLPKNVPFWNRNQLISQRFLYAFSILSYNFPGSGRSSTSTRPELKSIRFLIPRKAPSVPFPIYTEL